MTASFRGNRSGHTLIIAMLTIGVMVTVGFTTLSMVLTRYRTSYHAASWEDALRAAEAGADITVNLMGTTGTYNFSGWTGPTGGVYTRAFSASTNPALPAHSGEGGAALYASVRVDPIVNNGLTWYRIRSTGVASLPGSRATTYENALTDSLGKKNLHSELRHLIFKSDQTGGALPLPQVVRKVEVMAKPPTSSIFARSLTVATTIAMSGGGFTDSFDSSDPTKSTNGLYDIAKRQSHGDIATVVSGSLSDLKSTFVYGDALSNTGSYQNATNVQGVQKNNFNMTLPPVTDPTWTMFNPSPSVVNGTVTLAAGSQASPQRYKLDSLTVSAGKVLTLQNPTPGTPAYVEIWTTGKMTTSGSGIIVVQPGVHVTFYCDSDVTVSGGAINNGDQRAANVMLYGVTPASGTVPKFTVSGGGDMQAVVDAPGFDFVDSGTGNFEGAVIARSANISGGASFHYDEALKNLNSSGNGAFQIVSWFEDFE